MKLFFCVIVSFLSLQARAAEPVRHYMYVGRSDELLQDKDFLSSPQFEGAMVGYNWRELEKSKGHYNFEHIEENLNYLNSVGKKLFIYLKDTGGLSQPPVPDYIVKEPKYNGGVEYQYGDNGESKEAYGMAARRWDPEVMKRYQALMKELGQAFDGKIAGIRLGETALDVKMAGKKAVKGMSADTYVQAIKSDMLALKKAFPNTLVVQGANFMPLDEDNSRLREVYRYAVEIGVAVGEEDLMLDLKALKNNEIKGKRSHPAYEIMQDPEIKGKALIATMVEDGNYLGETGFDDKPTEPWPNIVPQMFQFVKENLNARYIFWQNQDPFFAYDVVPFIKAGN